MSEAALSFDALATRVLQRVWLRRWLGLLGQTLWWAAGAILLAGALRIGVWLPALAALGWIVGTGVIAWRRQPDKYAALALWDQVKGRAEAVAAAWWFTQQPALTPMQQRHVQAQNQLLPEATKTLARDLPLPWHRGLWVVPLVMAGVVALNLWHPSVPGDQPLTKAMQEAAKREAAKLADTAQQKQKLPGLTEAERQAAEKLKQEVAKTAKDLDKGNGTSAREVLMNLEKRARDAEQLAKQIGADTVAWASEKMIEAMRKHADTADLGDATANRNAAQTAKAATDIANTLKSPQLTSETRQRITETLADIQKASEEPDQKRVVASHVLAASEHLPQGRVKEAAEEFETLANVMRDKAQREQARKELEKLAQELRDAGSKIAGGQSGSMQQMQAAQSAQQQGQQMSQSMQQMLSQGANSAQQMQAPGLNQGQGQQMMMQQSQQPGSGPSQQMAVAPGQEGQKDSNQQNKPMLFAPVPGAKSDQQPSAMIMGNQPPTNQAGQMMQIPGSGLQAGQGSAKMNETKTLQQKAGQSSVVNARAGNDGNSSSRSIEGGVRQEAANRTAEQMAVETIHEQEAALDDAALPPARREQVRRYFQELRKRFEKAEAK